MHDRLLIDCFQFCCQFQLSRLIQRLKLECDRLLSSSAFSFNVRPYTQESELEAAEAAVEAANRRNNTASFGASSPGAAGWASPGKAVQVGPMKYVSKAPGTKRLKLKYDKPQSILL
jgi:hypothetical protein